MSKKPQVQEEVQKNKSLDKVCESLILRQKRVAFSFYGMGMNYKRPLVDKCEEYMRWRNRKVSRVSNNCGNKYAYDAVREKRIPRVFYNKEMQRQKNRYNGC